jgi:hypothetical protein
MMEGAPSLLIRGATVVYPCADQRETPVIYGWLRVDGPQISQLGEDPCPTQGPPWRSTISGAWRRTSSE